MTTIADDYVFTERLHEGTAVSVHRARRRTDGAPVILKLLAPERSTPARAQRLRNEHDIQRDVELPGVVRALGLDERDGSLALVLEDTGGEPLDSVLRRERLPLEASLRIAADIAGTLGHIHRRRVIHKDINPKNILLGEGLRAQIFDFSIATRLPRELQSVRSPNVLEGTLAYIAPEQTGRMSRPIDYRADLYSLGATLYVMLTGSPPFPAGDPMELIHCHIAKRPAPPSNLDPSIPGVVSDIVLRLLAKTADDRYKSAFGLKADLEECLRRLPEGSRIEPFPLGQRDVADPFQIPQKLYGREPEVAVLERAFERAARGGPELFLVTGYSGVGKSALVHELERSLAQTGGFFVTGKFDQLQRDIPYSAVLQALGNLVQHLLAESDGDIAAWRREIQAAVGSAGRVLVGVLPEIELVLGVQPPVPELPPAEAKNRFRTVFQDFIRAVARPGRPLVLFLDDLQWADASSLDLLAGLLCDPKAGALLVIGTYRDKEVSASHPLVAVAAQVEEAGCRTARLSLLPLAVSPIRELVADALSVTPDEARPLADLVWMKTQGSPLFTAELLTAMVKSGLLAFDVDRLRFTWDLPGIKRAPIGDNVVDLLAARTRALGEGAQEALKLAACLGARFDLHTLAIVSERPEADLSAALADAAQEGLVMPLGEQYEHALQATLEPSSSPAPSTAGPMSRAAYQFVHDRVQQAAYSLIPEARRREVHLTAGRLLLAGASARELEDRIFDIVNHLTIGAPLMTSHEERRALAELTCRAGKKAKAATAYTSAAGYLAAAAALLEGESWDDDYALTYEIHIELAECAYLSGGFDEAVRLCQVVLERAGTRIDKAPAYRLRIATHVSRGEHERGIAAGIEGLRLFGIEIRARPSEASVRDAYRATRERLRDHRIEDLLDLPLMTDLAMRAAMSILASTCLSAYFADQHLYELLACQIVDISVSHGNTGDSAMGYVSLGVGLCAKFGEYWEGYRLGKLAYDLTEKRGFQAFKAQVCNHFACMISIWTHGLDTCLEYSRIGLQAAREHGNLSYGAFNCVQILIARLVRGEPLRDVYEESVQALDFVNGTRTFFTADLVVGIQRFVQSVRGLTARLATFTGDGFEEEAFDAHMSTDGVPVVQCWYQVLKLTARFLAGDYVEAAVASAEADSLLWSCPTQPAAHEHAYYAALTAAARFPDTAEEERSPLRRILAASEEKLRAWAASCPETFRGKHALVAAEIARVEGRMNDACRLYDEAIGAFRESGFVHNEGMSHELFARFDLDEGDVASASSRLEEAVLCYERWGAHGKVRQLRERYPELLDAPLSSIPASIQAHDPPGAAGPPRTADPSSTSRAMSAFDVPSMIKASQALSSEIALDKLLSRLLTVAVENAGAERGALVLRRGPALWIEAEIAVGGGAVVTSSPVPLEQGRGLSAAIINYVVRTQKSVVLGDAAREGPFIRDTHVAAKKSKSVLCMPLVHQGDVKGALYLENNLTAGAFTEYRAELLSVLCSQVAISIENARLYADLEKIVAERTRQLREAQARLVQLEKEETETQMAGGFAHEMRNTLTGAKMLLGKVKSAGDGGGESLCVENSRKLMDIYVWVKEHATAEARGAVASLLKDINQNEERVDTALRDVDEALDRSLASTQTILEYSRLGRERCGSDHVLVRPLVELILKESGDDFAFYGIATAIDVAEGSFFMGKQVHLYSILKNLVVNARDALLESDSQGRRLLRVSLEQDSDQSVLRVEDTGTGVPAEDLARIFEPFFSKKPETGTGLGLGVVRKLVSLYGGTIAVESDVGRGTTFTISLPRIPPRTLPPSAPSTPPPSRSTPSSPPSRSTPSSPSSRSTPSLRSTPSSPSSPSSPPSARG